MTSRPQGRLSSIDGLRGLVMVLMALDHAREFLSPSALDPLDLTSSTPAWFLTRWVTHFCAPVFVFLAGTASFFKGELVGTRALSTWLVRRGFWIVLVEVVINNTAWFVSAWSRSGYILSLQVLWAIGVSMVALGVLMKAPRWVLAAVCIVMVLGHDLFNGIQAAGPGQQSAFDVAWSALHQQNVVLFPGGAGLLIFAYPLVPWVGVLGLGYLFGEWFARREQRARSTAALGVGLCAAFVLLRLTNAYGDPVPWTSSERGSLYTLLSFLNCAKYPPSLCYLLMTLGPSLVLLSLFEAASVPRQLVVFGRVPMFFYLAHVPLVHVAATAWGWFEGWPLGWMWAVVMGASPEGYHPSLAVTYVGWALLVVSLYPACVAWGRLKRARRGSWVDLF